MSTFLFLHGAFHGGWLWRKVGGLLQAQGHDCHTPTLSGCGYLARRSPHIDLQTYIDDVLNYIEDEELQDIILVSHGFSGLVGGAVMLLARHRLRHAIFVDAAIPRHRQSFFALADDKTRAMLDSDDEGFVAPWVPGVFGITVPLAGWFASRQRPFPARALHTPFPLPFAAQPLPATFMLGSMTPLAMYCDMARRAQELGWAVEQLYSGHCPMVTDPRHLTMKIVLTAASHYDACSLFAFP